MDFSPFSLLVVKVFSLITGGLGAEACAQILKVPLEELEPIIAELKEGFKNKYFNKRVRC